MLSYRTMKQISVNEETKTIFRKVLREMQYRHESDFTEDAAVQTLIEESDYDG